MFARAVLAFLLMPGVVAFLVPAMWVAYDGNVIVRPWGLLPLLVGAAGLLVCVRDFYVAGKGTLAPWTPPVRLVVVGLYRYTRNPMYVAVVLVLLGWAIAFGSSDLCGYAAVVALVFHLRVVLGEEPWLARTHGVDWDDYARRVPRWFL